MSLSSTPCSFLDVGGITIEDDVQIGPGVSLITENHPIDPAKRKYLDLKPVVNRTERVDRSAGNDLPGFTVGEN